MNQQAENSVFQNVLKFLYYPVPFLPDTSFIRQARLASLKQRALRKARKESTYERKIRGRIRILDNSRVEVCGHIIELNENTWVFGDLCQGAIAEVCLAEKAGIFTAKRLIITD